MGGRGEEIRANSKIECLNRQFSDIQDVISRVALIARRHSVLPVKTVG